MQPTHAQEQVQYASLGWRFAAVLIDTLVLFGLLIIAIMVYVLVLAARGSIDPNDPAAVQALSAELQRSTWITNVIVFGGLFLYYAILEAIFGASIGKLVFRMRVTMVDGSRPSGVALVVRNLVRIAEAWLLYIPAGISCLAGAKRQRLGDHAARTVVVRRGITVPAVAATPLPAYAPGPPPDLGLGQALEHLKTAALAARGAHLNYLRFSERELAASLGTQEDPAYSAEYVSAWYTLTGSVIALQKARVIADAAIAAGGTSLQAASADQPDLLHLFRELEPYLAAASDEQIHEAFLQVARDSATT